MKFSYSANITALPGSSDYALVRRPEIPITVHGPRGSLTVLALVDTGSDNTVFPASVARQLGIHHESDPDSLASAFGGAKLDLTVGEAGLELEADGESLRWPASICFFEFGSGRAETAILGHSGFLDFFVATFDSLRGELTLIPNSELPASKLA